MSVFQGSEACINGSAFLFPRVAATYPTSVSSFVRTRSNTPCNGNLWKGVELPTFPRRVVKIFNCCNLYRVIQKRSTHFQKFILQKLLTLNPCPVYGWKGNLSKFWYRWSEAAHHWGCGCCYLWHVATSVGRTGLSIWHLPRHTWGSHWVLVRCENNSDCSPFSLYIARRHMFNRTCTMNVWKCIILFE
jgi:hypothetical protein